MTEQQRHPSHLQLGEAAAAAATQCPTSQIKQHWNKAAVQELISRKHWNRAMRRDAVLGLKTVERKLDERSRGSLRGLDEGPGYWEMGILPRKKMQSPGSVL